VLIHKANEIIKLQKNPNKAVSHVLTIRFYSFAQNCKSALRRLISYKKVLIAVFNNIDNKERSNEEQFNTEKMQQRQITHRQMRLI
jgi:hypothetical protein